MNMGDNSFNCYSVSNIFQLIYIINIKLRVRILFICIRIVNIYVSNKRACYDICRYNIVYYEIIVYIFYKVDQYGY